MRMIKIKMMKNHRMIRMMRILSQKRMRWVKNKWNNWNRNTKVFLADPKWISVNIMNHPENSWVDHSWGSSSWQSLHTSFISWEKTWEKTRVNSQWPHHLMWSHHDLMPSSSSSHIIVITTIMILVIHVNHFLTKHQKIREDRRYSIIIIIHWRESMNICC